MRESKPADKKPKPIILSRRSVEKIMDQIEEATGWRPNVLLTTRPVIITDERYN